MTEGMLPPPKKSEELEFMESFIERALKAGLTDQECSKALALSRYWDTLEPAAEKLRKAANAGFTVIQATRNLMPALCSLLTEPTDLQDARAVSQAISLKKWTKATADLQLSNIQREALRTLINIGTKSGASLADFESLLNEWLS